MSRFPASRRGTDSKPQSAENERERHKWFGRGRSPRGALRAPGRYGSVPTAGIANGLFATKKAGSEIVKTVAEIFIYKSRFLTEKEALDMIDVFSKTYVIHPAVSQVLK